MAADLFENKTLKAINPNDAVFVICGSRGFIGSNLVRCLKERGFDCIEVHHDELSEANVSKLLESKQDKPIVLYLMAWAVSGRISPLIQLDSVNFMLRSLQVFSKFNVQRVICAGTIAEYEYLETVCSKHTPVISNCYGISRLYASLLAVNYCKEQKINLIRAAITNVYGPGEQSERLIVSSLRKIMNQEHLEFSDGSQLYDFIYIADAVRDLVSLGCEELALDHYVVGSGSFKPLREYLEELCRCFNLNEDKYRTFRPWQGDICTGARLMDADHCVCRFFNQNHRVGFSQGIKKTYEWLVNLRTDNIHQKLKSTADCLKFKKKTVS